MERGGSCSGKGWLSIGGGDVSMSYNDWLRSDWEKLSRLLTRWARPWVSGKECRIFRHCR